MAIPTAELKERDGNHYLSFPDGEYELTPKDLHRLNMDDQLALKVIRRKVRYYRVNGHLVWQILLWPKNFAEPIDLEQPVKDGAKLTHDQIALKYFYLKIPITKEDAEDIAWLHGQNSGQKLYLTYGKYHRTDYRTGRPDPYTKKTLQNKIDRFKSVVAILPESHKSQAKEELKVLTDLLEKDFLEK